VENIYGRLLAALSYEEMKSYLDLVFSKLLVNCTNQSGLTPEGTEFGFFICFFGDRSRWKSENMLAVLCVQGYISV